MPELVKKHGVEQVVFAYSDVPYEYVMHRSALVNALGADFRLLGPDHTMVKSTKPVIAVCAVRTGAGKSQTIAQDPDHAARGLALASACAPQTAITCWCSMWSCPAWTALRP